MNLKFDRKVCTCTVPEMYTVVPELYCDTRKVHTLKQFLTLT